MTEIYDEMISAWDLKNIVSYHHDLFRSEVRKIFDIQDYFNGLYSQNVDDTFSFSVISKKERREEFVNRIMISSNYEKQVSNFFVQFMGGHYLEISKEIGQDELSVISSCFAVSTIEALLETEIPYVIEILDYMNFYAHVFESNIYGMSFIDKKKTSFDYQDASCRLHFSFLDSESLSISHQGKTKDNEALLKSTFIPLSSLPHSYLELVLLNQKVRDMEENKTKEKH